MARRRLTAVVAGALGAGAAYFMDPDRGRSRRTQARDQVTAKLRRRSRQAASEARYAEGRIEGQRAKASGAGEFTPEDDIQIVHAIEAALARLEFSTSDVNVDVVEGVASLRGQVETAEQMDQVAEAVRETNGVTEVRSYLHTPGTPAPNKAASINVS